MKKVIWNVEYLSLPLVIKYCKKCGSEAKFICSEKFRVNAQKKALDIWLIYKCCGCDNTWNARIYEHITAQALGKKILEDFYSNNFSLVKKYAMDAEFLYNNGITAICLPEYLVKGEDFSLDETVELEIKSRFALPLKAASVIRNKMGLTQNEYLQMIGSGKIKSVFGQDLRKCRIKKSIKLVFNKPDNERL